MVSRLDRDRPLPDVLAVRVEDSKTQRALDALATPLRAVVEFLQAQVQPEKWQDLPLRSGMAVFSGKLQFKKDAARIVRFQGNALRSSGASTVVGVLPQGYRPAQRLYFNAVTLSGAAYVASRVDVDVDGRVLVASGGFDFIMLDGITFEAA